MVTCQYHCSVIAGTFIDCGTKKCKVFAIANCHRTCIKINSCSHIVCIPCPFNLSRTSHANIIFIIPIFSPLLYKTKNRFGSKTHIWDLQLKEQLISDPRLHGETSVYLTGGDRSEAEGPEDRKQALIELLWKHGELSNAKLKELAGFKPDNYLKDDEFVKGEGRYGLWSTTLEAPEVL